MPVSMLLPAALAGQTMRLADVLSFVIIARALRIVKIELLSATSFS